MEIATETRTEYEIERKKPMPSTAHAIIQGNLIFELNMLYRKNFRLLPEINIEIADSFSVPDIAIYPQFDFDVTQDVIRRTDPPLATIEILSPTQALQDLVDKTDVYFHFGVKSCWIVLPALRAIVVYHQVGKYKFFTEEDTLQDINLNIELPLYEIFK
ncbi:MAG: Uma2 family endonuclease [Thermoflexibacter sp.]|jgi:Uma2 family endonuclease|nr:Uma2 family endonuclease [Thermoflexibacter sp.]